MEKVVELANATKDEATLKAAEDELYRRWVDMGDEQAQNYFLADIRPVKNQSKAVAFSESTHGQELKARHEAARDAKGGPSRSGARPEIRRSPRAAPERLSAADDAQAPGRAGGVAGSCAGGAWVWGSTVSRK